MIIDSNLVLVDSAALSGTVTSNVVGLTSLKKPGKFDAIPIYFGCTGDVAGGTSIAVKLQQSDTSSGEFADVPGSSMTLLLADLQAIAAGGHAPYKYLPRGVTKPWIKMVVTATGTFTGGKFFAAIMREDDEPYEEGFYIDRGVDFSSGGADTSGGGA